MPNITQDDIEQIAHLAHLALESQEIQMYQKDLSVVLGYFDKLASVEVDNTQEIGHITGMKNVYRDDVAYPADEDTKEALMANVPSHSDGYITVKNVL